MHSTTAIRTCQVSMTGLSVQDVGNCLSVEASATIKGVKVDAQTSYCKNKGKKLQNSNSFSGSFSDRVTEVLGGDGSHSDLLFAPDKQHGYTAWLKTHNLCSMFVYRLFSITYFLPKDLFSLLIKAVLIFLFL